MASLIGNLMKTKIIIALIFTGLFSPAFLHSEDMEENLVKNSGFEDDTAGGNPEGYVLWKADDKGICCIDDSFGYKSEKSVKMVGVSLGNYQYSIPVLPGERYLVESLCRQKGKGKPAMNVYWKDAKGSFNWPICKTKEVYKQFDGKWRKAEAKVRVPAAGALQLTVLLSVEAQESETDIAWFDNVSIKKLPEEKETAVAEKKPSAETPALYKIKRVILPPVVQLESGEYSLNHSQQEVMNTLRMYSFQYGVISQEEAEKQIEKIRNGGFNAILTEHQRYLFVENTNHTYLRAPLYGSLPYTENVRCTKIVADACHKYGLKVYLHLTQSVVHDNITNEHPDWMTLGVNDGKQKQFWGCLFACLNNDDYSREYFKRLDYLIKESSPDGLMVDESNLLYDTCGCSWCREKFQKETGIDLPEAGTLWFGDLSSSVYKRFLAWRVEKFKQEQQKIKKVLNKYRPDGKILAYYAAPYYEKAWADHSTSIDATGEIADTVGWEVLASFNKVINQQWPAFISTLKMVRAVSELKNGNCWFVDSYHKKYPDLFFHWLLGLSQGAHQYWSLYRQYPAVDALSQWEMKHESFLAGLRNSADLAVVLSTFNNNSIQASSGQINRASSFFAVGSALTLAHIPYKVITDKDIQSPGLNDKAKTVIMMNIGILSDSQAETIRQFVKNGGTLIASAETSLYTSEGKKRSDFALSDVFGCKYIKPSVETSSLMIKEKQPLLGNVTGEINPPDEYCVVEASGSAKVLGSFLDEDDKNIPGLLVNNFGKGKVIYFAGHPETSLYIAEYNAGVFTSRDINDPRDPKMVGLLEGLIRSTSGSSVIAANFPTGVVVETYSHNYQGAQGIQVHLLNLTGMVSNVLSGETNEITFPEIKNLLPDPAKPMQITVHDKDIRNAFLLSPDFSGLYELPIETKGEDVTCTIPSLARYLIIYFNQGETGYVQKLAKIPVSSGQPKMFQLEKIIEPRTNTKNKTAAGARVSASSRLDETMDALKAFDDVCSGDDPQNCWCTANKQDVNSWWMIELKDEKSVKTIKVQYRNIGEVFRFTPLSITTQTSRDGINWINVIAKSTDVPKEGTSYEDKMYEYQVGRTAKYLRLLFEDGGPDFAGYKVIELVEVAIE